MQGRSSECRNLSQKWPFKANQKRNMMYFQKVKMKVKALWITHSSPFFSQAKKWRSTVLTWLRLAKNWTLPRMCPLKSLRALMYFLETNSEFKFRRNIRESESQRLSRWSPKSGKNWPNNKSRSTRRQPSATKTDLPLNWPNWATLETILSCIRFPKNHSPPTCSSFER